MSMGTLLLMGLVIALVVLGARRVFAGHPRLDVPPQSLARRELAFLAAAADSYYPAGGAIPTSGTEAGVPAYTDRYVGMLPRPIRLLIRLLFFLVEHVTLVMPAKGPGGRRRFSSLEPAQRQAWLEGWRTSRLPPRRLVFTSLRAILAMGYLADPSVLRAIGLAPYAIASPVVEADLLYPPVGRGPDAIRFTRADLTPPGPVTPLDLDGPLHSDYAEGAS